MSFEHNLFSWNKAPTIAAAAAAGVLALLFIKHDHHDPGFPVCEGTPTIAATTSTSSHDYSPSTDPAKLEHIQPADSQNASSSGFDGTTCILNGRLWLTVQGEKDRHDYMAGHAVQTPEN